MLHTGFGAQAVEVRRLGALRHRRGHRTVVEGDVIQGRDPVKHAEADLSQGDLEGLGDASQLHRDTVPAGSLVVQGPPYDRVVVGPVHAEVHVCSPHRYARVIMPEGDDGEREKKMYCIYLKAFALWG